jgi:hypothetical protein
VRRGVASFWPSLWLEGTGQKPNLLFKNPCLLGPCNPLKSKIELGSFNCSKFIC